MKRLKVVPGRLRSGPPGGDAVRVAPTPIDLALDVLCSPELAHVVELVAWSPAPGKYEARSVDGHVAFWPEDGAGSRAPGPPRYASSTISGRDILSDQDPSKFSPLCSELGHLQPGRAVNSYPYAYEHLAQVFDHQCAPDICVFHTAAHGYEGHRGEHGSLSVIQARAPFILSGAGVRRQGLVDGHCRLVDVAPTVLALLGVPAAAHAGPLGGTVAGSHLARQDGVARTDLLEAVAERVIGFLLDGCNANVLYDAASRGEAPNVARLISGGTALRQGAVASVPTVTLPNHTTILTGCHPGHHGVLHNAWYDRKLGSQVVTESPTTWQTSMQWLAPGVETVHSALKRCRPGAFTVSLNEPADAGADYSTFDYFRKGEEASLRPGRDAPLPFTDEGHFASSRSYRRASIADTMSLNQALGILGGSYLGVSYEVPTFMWVNTSLTDAAFHEGGPHSDIARAAVRDSDARVGEILAAVERAGLADSTAYVLVADHGMEHTAEDVVGGWARQLRDAGLVFRDESASFLYLGVEPATPT